MVPGVHVDEMALVLEDLAGGAGEGEDVRRYGARRWAAMWRGDAVAGGSPSRGVEARAVHVVAAAVPLDAVVVGGSVGVTLKPVEAVVGVVEVLVLRLVEVAAAEAHCSASLEKDPVSHPPPPVPHHRPI